MTFSALSAEADIAISNLSFSPSTYEIGDHPDVVSFTITNNGPADMVSPDTRVEIHYYLSSNTIYGDSDDIFMGTDGADLTIDSGGSYSAALTPTGLSNITIPSVALGDYYVFASINHSPPSSLTDPLISNNYTIRTGTITIQDPPPSTHTITASSSLGGFISPSGSVTVDDGANQLFTAYPSTGYYVDYWLLDGSIDQVGGSTYTVSNVTYNRTLQVVFRAVTYTINANSGPGGTISPSGSVTVSHGSNKTFNAVPQEGYMVDSWSLNGSIDQTGQETYTITNITGDNDIS